MDLQDLHQRTGISKRKLRYCLDHQLVPGLKIKIAADEAGRPRKFHEDVGFGIACAAHLLESGLSHRAIRAFLGGLTEMRIQLRGNSKSLLVCFMERGGPGKAHLGDGVNVRMVAEDAEFDSGWIAPGNPAQLAGSYSPAVEIILNVGRLHGQVFGGTENNS